jgi:hypothetical protein
VLLSSVAAETMSKRVFATKQSSPASVAAAGQNFSEQAE